MPIIASMTVSSTPHTETSLATQQQFLDGRS